MKHLTKFAIFIALLIPSFANASAGGSFSPDIINMIASGQQIHIEMKGRDVLIEGTLYPLEQAKKLELKNVYIENVDDDQLDLVGELNSILILSLEKAQVSPAGLSRLNKLAKLISFEISNSNIGNKGLEAIMNALLLTPLHRLKLINCNIGDDGIKYMTSHNLPPRLNNINFSDNNRITTEGIRYLANLSKRIEVLNLYLDVEISNEAKNILTDAGLNELTPGQWKKR